jgi:hypothetical protein
MSSILSFPDRGQWGSAAWRGNCSGHVYKSLFEQVRPSFFVDPMVGSGTSVEVATEMGIEAVGLDLHSGFNILRDSVLEAVGGREADLVVSHPPYHDMVVYSGEQYAGAHPDDLSRCTSVDEFNEKLHVALLNQRNATRPDGIYGMIMGDMRRAGRYHCFTAEMIARLPSDELAAVIIKGQHNTTSGRQSYGRMRFPFITHEYLVLWTRKAAIRSTLGLLGAMARQAHQRLQGVWKAVIHECFVRSGKEAMPLADLYQVVAANAPEKVAANENWRAKVRQTLQSDPRFQSVDRGVWALKAA